MGQTMMKDQVIDAFIAALLWEGVTEQQVDAALTALERLRLGEDFASGSKVVRTFAFARGARFRALTRPAILE